MRLKTRVVLVLLTSVALVSLAESVGLIWSPNKESDLAGYKVVVYQNGANLVEEIPTEATTTVVSGLDPNTIYGFGVFAVNRSNLWSLESERIYTRGAVSIPIPIELALPTPTGYKAIPQ